MRTEFAEFKVTDKNEFTYHDQVGRDELPTSFIYYPTYVIAVPLLFLKTNHYIQKTVSMDETPTRLIKNIFLATVHIIETSFGTVISIVGCFQLRHVPPDGNLTRIAGFDFKNCELPNYLDQLGEIKSDICYINSNRHFNFNTNKRSL